MERRILNIRNTVDNVQPVLHRLYCDCGKELILPAGVWHKTGFKWHYKCECGVQFESSLIFPRIEYMLKHEDGRLERFTSSGHTMGEIKSSVNDKGTT